MAQLRDAAPLAGVKPISPRAAELLAQLHRPPTWSERLLGEQGNGVAALEALAGHAVPALVPALAPLAFASSAPVRRAAAAVLERALATATPTELVEVDQACRVRSGYSLPANAWDTLKPVRLAGLDAGALGALAVASFHPSGYVREAAIARLDAWTDGRELPFLLVRLNDWVPVVARRAREAVERRILPKYAEAWLAWLPLLLRLGSRTRRDPGDLAEQVFTLLGAPEQRGVLLSTLSSGTRATRRIVIRLLRRVQSSAGERTQVVADALDDADTVVRFESVAYAKEHLPDDELERTISTVLADRYSPLRRAALSAAAERLGQRADRWLLRSLLDRSGIVREAACFYLARRGTLTEFAPHYRREVGAANTVAHLAAAVAGLGETGAADDAALLTPLLTHESPSVRRSVVRALARLDLDREAPRLVAILDDPSRSVAYAARDALRQRTHVLDAARVTELIKHAIHPHGRLAALALAGGLSKWDSIGSLVEAAGSPDSRIRDEAIERILYWLARQNLSFSQPSAKQRTALAAALSTYGDALTPRTRLELRSLADYWSAH